MACPSISDDLRVEVEVAENALRMRIQRNTTHTSNYTTKSNSVADGDWGATKADTAKLLSSKP